MPPEVHALERDGAAAGPERSAWRRFEFVSFAAGTALLVWLMVRVGPATLARNLAEIGGWGFLLIIGLQAAPVLLNTLAWRLVLPPGAGVSWSALAPMLVAGEAINTVSPVGLVGGELVRISLLRRRLPTSSAAASVGLAATTQFAGQTLFILLGLPVVLTLVQNPGLRSGLVMAASAISLLLASLLFVAWSPVRLARARGALFRFAWAERLLTRVPVTGRDAVAQGLDSLRARPGAFGLSVAASCAAWMVGAAETLVILRLLGQPVGLARAYAIEALAVAIEGALFFVPAKMGTQEGGRMLVFLALGLDPASGLALGLVRRAREIVWAVPGLALFGNFQRSPAPRAASRPSGAVTRGERPLPD